MVKAIGIDMVSVDRIRRAMRNPRFLERVLTRAEQRRELTPAYVAGRWAAKEAAAKCLPTLRRWHDIEVGTAEGGAPVVTFADGILADNERLLVSITHEKGHAAAVAVLVAGPDC